MSNLEVGILILLVVGIIASNLAVLKYSAKFKMTQFGKKDPKELQPKKDAAKSDEQKSSKADDQS
ncbi:hypothetical protein TUM4438_28740 [Shewanella sairae]|uniref:DUF2897 family protein n=1 Tax=Shewanella sairae TaxID=190310 RepID=A0ABQ4PK43_9GAMM|nr:DUF2897 family protein [Shewanella sairae]MCL1130282.1 DUF2897 family protein [Shewanella sairae]GIU48101.1 hypothetical protein TUM4438_28740 [Shewanella sairae]